MNRSFSYYADGVLSKILGVVLAAVTFSYYVRGANLILFSLVFGFCASEVYLFFIDKKPTERKVPTEIEYSLCGIGIENGTALIRSLAGDDATERNGLVIKNGSAAVWRINFSPLSADDVVEIVALKRKENIGNVTILANRIEENATRLAYEAGVSVLPLAASLDALIKLGYRPAVIKNKSRCGLKQTLLSKTRAKGYLVCAVMLLVSARWVRFSVWYVVAAGVMIALCAISLIPRKN